MENNNHLPDLDKLVDLDKVIHERVRLGIMSALTAPQELSFIEIKGILNVTDGNLARHLRILEENGYITAEKKFIGRKPNTSYKLTNSGKEAFKDYITRLEKLVRDIQID